MSLSHDSLAYPAPLAPAVCVSRTLTALSDGSQMKAKVDESGVSEICSAVCLPLYWVAQQNEPLQELWLHWDS